MSFKKIIALAVIITITFSIAETKQLEEVSRDGKSSSIIDVTDYLLNRGYNNDEAIELTSELSKEELNEIEQQIKKSKSGGIQEGEVVLYAVALTLIIGLIYLASGD
ncbi:MAG: hypothetical protein PHF33_05160 [Candidatus Delongbacteria bacterium]|nr:hypothetical protein [Candidatus Delongbacteria bacterium]